jgi:hypothetical protein
VLVVVESSEEVILSTTLKGALTTSPWALLAAEQLTIFVQPVTTNGEWYSGKKLLRVGTSSNQCCDFKFDGRF